MPRKLSRRKFLGEASCSALGSTSILSTILNLQMANNAVAAGAGATAGRKTLVCLFLSGGWGCLSFQVFGLDFGDEVTDVFFHFNLACIILKFGRHIDNYSTLVPPKLMNNTRC